ncbi:MAG: hypothetical protein JSU63_14640 [Phycisphaerales bacterium]|nr:MAG: hypothetical protein JSU63_14640 [Phycisphaerales bacterium]
MENFAPRHRTVVSLALCVLLIGFLALGTACPPPGPTTCATDADCPDGQVCNTTTGLCEAAPAGCTSDDDCEEGETCDTDTGDCIGAAGCTSDDDCADGEFCDVVTGECITNVNLYANVAFDHDYHEGAFTCDWCHHDGAGFDTCDTCHDRDEVVGGLRVLKDVQHDPEGGCWECHSVANDDGTRDCSFCHTDLDQ